MKRFRKFRTNRKVRDRYAETRLKKADFIYPYFVVEGKRIKKEIPSFPGVYHFSADRLLANSEADALFWVSSFNPDRTPPAARIPTVVFGHAQMKLDKEPDVFIPIGTPGANHKGVMFRTDNVVSLPLQKLRNSALPTLAEVLSAIEQAYTETAAC